MRPPLVAPFFVPRIFRQPTLQLCLLFFSCLLLASSLPAQNPIGETYELTVRVRDQRRDTPIEAATVRLEHFPDRVVSEEFTDSLGRVVFHGLGVGSYIFHASKAGYQTAEGRADFRRGDGSQTTEITISPVDPDHPSGPGGAISKQLLAVPEEARKEFERALHLLNDAKNPAECILALNRAIELYADYADAYVLLGVAQIQLKDFSAGEKALRKAITLAPRSTAPYYPLATLLYGQKRIQEEEALLNDAEKLDPTDWKWPFELARASADSARWDAALNYAKTSATLKDAPSKVHLLLADIYSNSGHAREAIAELEEFARLDPKSAYMPRVREVLPALRQRALTEAPAEAQQP